MLKDDLIFMLMPIRVGFWANSLRLLGHKRLVLLTLLLLGFPGWFALIIVRFAGRLLGGNPILILYGCC